MRKIVAASENEKRFFIMENDLKTFWNVKNVFVMEMGSVVIIEADHGDSRDICQEVVFFRDGSVSVVDTSLGIHKVRFSSLREYIEKVKP